MSTANAEPRSEALKTAELALEHILLRIHRHPGIGYYMGHGTESFESAVAAYALIVDEDPDTIREEFAPVAPKNPATDESLREDGPVRLQVTREEKDTLGAIVAFHEHMERSSREAASLANAQLGFGLHAKADQHRSWAGAIDSLRDRTVVPE